MEAVILASYITSISTFKSALISNLYDINMDIMFKIVIVSLSIIIVVALGVSFFSSFYDKSSPYDNSAECREMERNLFKHELAFNQSAAHYRYRADALEGQFDLPGDLAAWRNHLVNDYNKLQHETNNLEDMCSTIGTQMN